MGQTTFDGKELSDAKPFLKWAGGKGRLLGKLNKFFPKNYNRYFEPFIGGGAIFFHLNPEKAIINDLNEELVNLYKIIKDIPEELMEELDKLQNKVSDKDFFLKMRSKKPKKELEKAVRMVFLNRTCYNGMYRVNSKGEFNVPFGDMGNPKLYQKKNILACSHTLKKTTILNGDYKKLNRRIRENDFVYLDPPYVPHSETAHFTSYTSEKFGKEQQLELLTFCEKIDKKGGLFMLSNSYNEYTEELYQKFNINTIKAARSVAAKSESRAEIKEIVVTNYL